MEDSGDFPGRPSVPRQAGREPPPPALNKEPFAGTGAPAPGRLLRPESAGSVLPLLAIHAESGGAQAGGGDPRSAHGFASPPRHRAAPGQSCSPPQNFGGSALRPRGGEAGPPTRLRGLSTTSIPSRSPGWLKGRPQLGLGLGYPAHEAGEVPRVQELRGRSRMETSGGAHRPGAHQAAGAPTGPRGFTATWPTPLRHQNGCSRHSPASAPRHRPHAPPGLGAARGPFTTPAPDALRGLGPRGRGWASGVDLAPGARRTTRAPRPEDAGRRRPPTRPRPRPRRWYLVWARAAMRADD